MTGAGSSGGYGSGDSNGDEQQSPDGSGESGDLTKATYTWDENTKTITFTGPGEVTSIDSGAFSKNENLTSVTIEAATPPEVNEYDNPFESCHQDLKIKIPEGSLDAYMASDKWSDYEYTAFGALQSISVTPDTASFYFRTGDEKSIVALRIIDVIEVKAIYENYSKIIDAKINYTNTADLTSLARNKWYISIPDRENAVIGYGGKSATIKLNAIPNPNDLSVSEYITWNEATKTITFKYISSSFLGSTDNDWDAYYNTKTHLYVEKNFYKPIVENVIIEQGFETINDNTFSNCTSLKNVVIPDTVTEIEHRAFMNCTSLESVIMQSTNPPTLNYYYWGMGLISTATIYVPDSSVSSYKNAEYWEKYKDQIKPISEYTRGN